MNKKHKKIGLFGLILGSLIKLLFFTKKTPTLHQNVPQYNPQASDQEYVEVNVTNKQPDFTHPTAKMKHPVYDNNQQNDFLRSPDGSA